MSPLVQLQKLVLNQIEGKIRMGLGCGEAIRSGFNPSVTIALTAWRPYSFSIHPKRIRSVPKGVKADWFS